MAAVFEEYVRQQVKAAFKEKCKRADGINEFPHNLAVKVWRLSLERLARTRIDGIEASLSTLEERFAAVVSFAIKKDVLSDVSDIVAHNEHNMRPKQMAELFNLIGISDILLKACKDQNLKDYLDRDEDKKTQTVLVTRIEDFFRRRNDVAHAINYGSSSGPSEINQDVQLFRAFGQSLYKALNSELPPVETGM